MTSVEQAEYYSNLPLPIEPPPIAVIPGPANPPWNSLESVAVWIASVLFILIIPAIFLIPYLAMQSPPITDGEQIIEFAKSDPTSIILQIAAIIPAHIFTIILAWLVVTRLRKYDFRKTLGWDSGGFRWWHYCIILGAFLAIAAVVGSYFPEKENDLIRILHSSRSAVYIVALVATFTAPFVEEVVYRGVLYSAFQRTFGVPAAFILVTFLFAIVHVPQYYPSYSTIFLLTVLSLTLTSIRVRSNNLLPCIILHTLFNGFQSVLLILEPFLKSFEVQEQAATIFRILK
ncbi:MAG: CPBP family intramembrane glutamic endopeptidase [Pyrinomonadaceae bacterium]